MPSWKVVASVGGELISVYDGTTRYTVGRWTLGKCGANGWPPLSSCYYAYKAVDKALTAKFPKASKHLTAPKVLIQAVACGKAYYNPELSMWALSSVRPARILPDIVPKRCDANSFGVPTDAGSLECARLVAQHNTKAQPWVP
ncbi:hypothetical protein VOLCADRAFT_86562 [Volvox carteri f. nagariensis]|uniref:Uncharacterized protein n=1 Tax=Volvox carteri f. nagariensis TaxID=3068 RepID=D8TJ03_VOLCA|nr:uncharacterized protein VOLCADRAFT_86562 [Volvox carteri f. nagariensis]EFJ52289.1 hypothetical protein VOLCADRAFT_86562 [Volvox carteri f. nagariensis]|eukprot:XP_002946362.1 hypothetical protein VOLCADRAFT_86562 [Volvox carteri f. nagariensis]